MTERLMNYLGGEMVPPRGETYLENHEPATGRVYSEVPDSDARDVEALGNAPASRYRHLVAEGQAYLFQESIAFRVDSGVTTKTSILVRRSLLFPSRCSIHLRADQTFKLLIWFRWCNQKFIYGHRRTNCFCLFLCAGCKWRNLFSR